MSSNQGPPPYSEPSFNVKTSGPQQYPPGQPYMGPPYGQPYMGPPYGGGAPVIINMQQQQQQQQQQQVIVQRSGTHHGLCCLLCFFTGGLTIPCWIYACIVD